MKKMLVSGWEEEKERKRKKKKKREMIILKSESIPDERKIKR